MLGRTKTILGDSAPHRPLPRELGAVLEAPHQFGAPTLLDELGVEGEPRRREVLVQLEAPAAARVGGQMVQRGGGIDALMRAASGHSATRCEGVTPASRLADVRTFVRT